MAVEMSVSVYSVDSVDSVYLENDDYAVSVLVDNSTGQADRQLPQPSVLAVLQWRYSQAPVVYRGVYTRSFP